MAEPDSLVLAVPSKGRLQENAAAFFARAGLTFAPGSGVRDYRGKLVGVAHVEVRYLSASEIAKTTRLNRFDMDGSKRSALDFLKKLRGKPGAQSNGARQMAMIRKLPKILRFIPGAAQDVRA